MVLAVEKFYDLQSGPRSLVACDNLGGLRIKRFHQAQSTPISCIVYVEFMLRFVVHCNINTSMATKINTRNGSR
jgi:3-methyladenine DNA glycosylase/8-oxoguanine DNA glycosylase